MPVGIDHVKHTLSPGLFVGWVHNLYSCFDRSRKHRVQIIGFEAEFKVLAPQCAGIVYRNAKDHLVGVVYLPEREAAREAQIESHIHRHFLLKQTFVELARGGDVFNKNYGWLALDMHGFLLAIRSCRANCQFALAASYQLALQQCLLHVIDGCGVLVARLADDLNHRPACGGIGHRAEGVRVADAARQRPDLPH